LLSSGGLQQYRIRCSSGQPQRAVSQGCRQLRTLGKLIFEYCHLFDQITRTTRMTQHDHHQGHHHGENHQGRTRTQLHKDWRAWLVVALMLAAMAMYLLSLDESVQPGQSVPGPPTPADAGL
jgi:hypothetical protein